jgi:hypothetical protein
MTDRLARFHLGEARNAAYAAGWTISGLATPVIRQPAISPMPK